MLGDGKVERYKTDKVDIAVYREGNSFTVYDYNEKAPSRALSRSEVNSVLEQLKSADSAADVAKTLKAAENAGLTSTEQGNVSVSGGNSLQNSENSLKTSENSLSPSARMAIDTEGEKRYNRSGIKPRINPKKIGLRPKRSPYMSYAKVGSAKIDLIREEISNIFGQEDGIANSVAIEVGNTVYTVDAGRENSLIDFGVRKKRVINDPVARERYIRRINDDASRKGRLSDGLYVQDRGRLRRDSGRGMRSEHRDQPKIDTGKPKNNAGRTTEPDRQDGRGVTDNNAEKSSKEKIAELKERIDKKKIDAYCRENIEEYASMSAANQSMIRQVVREGRVYGLDEADILSYARVAARSGVNIVFDATMQNAEFKMQNDNPSVADATAPFTQGSRDGGDIAGYYDPENNRIVVNPKAEKRQELILIHELDHAIRAYLGDDGKIHYIAYKGAEQRLSKETRDFVRGKEYSEQEIDVSREELFADEASAYYTEAILGPKVTIDMLLGKEPSLAKKILNFFTGAARAYSKDAKLSKEARAHYRRFKKMFDDFAEWNKGRNAETAVESVGDGKATRKSSDAITPKITVGMTDEERYEIIKTKKIIAPFYEGQADALISNYENKLESKKIEFAKESILEIAEKLGVVNANINIEDVEVEIKLSKSNLKESVVKDATPKQIAKLLPILSKTVQKATIIERHHNRYYYDTDTVYFDNLLGAYVDENTIVPVRFGLKHSRTGTTTLYVIVDQNKIPLEKIGKTKNDRGLQDASPTKEESDSLHRSVTYSISQIVPFVNSKDLLRYLPDGMLDEKQRTAKWEAIAETIRRTNKKNDEKYAKYIAQGNLIAARQMVSAKARMEGYTVKAYHGTQTPEIKVFRASEEGALGKGIYFSESKEYADGRANGGKTYEVYLKIDKPYEVNYPGGINQEKLITQGYNGVHHEGNGFWVAFYPEQVKSAEAITYDDNGNVIPLSERFNSENKDRRYSKDITPKLEDAEDSDKVTISKGQAQKLAANYNSDRVYDKKDVVTAFRGIDGFANLSEDMQKELLRDVWVGLNSRYGKGARETFVEVMSNKIPYMLLTESYTEENAAKYF